MKRFIISTAVLLVISGFAYSYSSGNFSFVGKSEEVMCDMPGMSGMSVHDHQAMMAQTAAVAGQNPVQDQDQGQNPRPGQGGQPGDTDTHRFSPGDGCSAVNPNAPNKERDGVNPNTVGCKCVRKLPCDANNKPTEDLSRDDKGVYICKNACHKDRCSCPDPCKS